VGRVGPAGDARPLRFVAVATLPAAVVGGLELALDEGGGPRCARLSRRRWCKSELALDEGGGPRCARLSRHRWCRSELALEERSGQRRARPSRRSWSGQSWLWMRERGSGRRATFRRRLCRDALLEGIGCTRKTIQRPSSKISTHTNSA
jgi:hypothetical protein